MRMCEALASTYLFLLPNDSMNFTTSPTLFRPRHFVLITSVVVILACFAQTVVVLSQTKTVLVVSQPDCFARSAAFRLDLFHSAKIL